MKSLLFVSLLLASRAVAAPKRLGRSKRNSNLGARQEGYGTGATDDLQDESSICGNHADLRTWDDRQVASDLWWSTAAGYKLDSYIKLTFLDNGRTDLGGWLQEFNLLRKNDQTDDALWQCASTDSAGCQMEGSCSDYFMDPEEQDAEYQRALEEDPDNPQPSYTDAQQYYINYAAVKVFETFRAFNERLQDWAIINGFSANQIVEDFSPDQATLDPWALASGAFGAASGLFAGSTPISGAFAALSGVFAIVGEAQGDENDPAADVQTQVAAYFSKALAKSDETLRIVFDGTAEEMETLPGQTEDYFNDTPLGRFFADGKFIYNDIGTALNETLDRGGQLLSAGIAFGLMKNLDYFIWVDTSVTDAGSCTGGPRTWVDALGHCATIITHTAYACDTNGVVANCDGAAYDLEQEKWDKLVDTSEGAMYALDPVSTYLNAYDCQKNHPDGDGGVDINALEYGTIPACFFNIPVKKGTYEGKANKWNYEDL